DGFIIFSSSNCTELSNSLSLEKINQEFIKKSQNINWNSIEFLANKSNDENINTLDYNSKTLYSNNNIINDYNNNSVNLQNTNTSTKNSKRKIYTKNGKHSDFQKQILNSWFINNIKYPYPTEEEKDIICTLTTLSRTQVNNWFTNARRR